MRERRTLRRDRTADVQRDARVALRAVPVAPVPLELAEPDGNLIGRRLDLLQAHDVGPLALDPVLQLSLTRADTVDVPCPDFDHNSDSSCGTGLATECDAAEASAPCGVNGGEKRR